MKCKPEELLEAINSIPGICKESKEAIVRLFEKMEGVELVAPVKPAITDIEPGDIFDFGAHTYSLLITTGYDQSLWGLVGAGTHKLFTMWGLPQDRWLTDKVDMIRYLNSTKAKFVGRHDPTLRIP